MTPCTCHPGNVCASAASCAAARRVEFGANMTTTQADALPEHTIGKHDHPEPHTMCWSDLELGAIKRYAESYALAALQSQPAAAGVSDAGAPFGMLRTTCPYCEQGFAFDRPEADASDELVDQHLDAILRTAGSALRHYTMQKSKDDMRSALRRAILALRPQAVPMTGQWRLLRSGERIESGDECLQDDCVAWLPLAGWEVGMTYNPTALVPMRRRVPGITAQGAQGEQA